MHVVTVVAVGFAVEGFHSRIPSVEHLHVFEVEHILSETLVSCLVVLEDELGLHFQLDWT